jgi:hypothetical protein
MGDKLDRHPAGKGTAALCRPPRAFPGHRGRPSRVGNFSTLAGGTERSAGGREAPHEGRVMGLDLNDIKSQ